MDPSALTSQQYQPKRQQFMTKPTTMTATDLQRKSGEILRRTFNDGEHFIIERAGFPVAALIPIKVYEQLVHDSRNKASVKL